ncbi:MAG: ATP-binding protein, partial [Solirubrobacterales bacterium]
WADAASLDFLRFLLPRLEELPVLLVIACRPDEAGAERSLARIATDSIARRLTPRALSPEAAAALLAGALDREPAQAFTTTCHQVSGGNPSCSASWRARSRPRRSTPPPMRPRACTRWHRSA